MMELIFWWPLGLLAKFNDIIVSMNIEKNIEHLFLAGIIGIASLGVSFISDMSRNVQAMTISVQELNAKMGLFDGTIRDHEQRLREVEKNNIRR